MLKFHETFENLRHALTQNWPRVVNWPVVERLSQIILPGHAFDLKICAGVNTVGGPPRFYPVTTVIIETRILEVNSWVLYFRPLPWYVSKSGASCLKRAVRLSSVIGQFIQRTIAELGYAALSRHNAPNPCCDNACRKKSK